MRGPGCLPEDPLPAIMDGEGDSAVTVVNTRYGHRLLAASLDDGTQIITIFIKMVDRVLYRDHYFSGLAAILDYKNRARFTKQLESVGTSSTYCSSSNSKLIKG